VTRTRAATARRGALLCLHAMMTDGRYFRALARAASEVGYDVHVLDFRGHGASTPLADWSFDDLVDLDLPALIAAADCPPDEIVICGHSLGGLVAIAALGCGRIPPVRAVLLPATAPWLGGSWRRRALMAVYREVTRALGKAPIRALRLGTADEARTYVAQLTGWMRSGRWTSLRGIDYLAAARTIDVPVYPVAGDRDWMCTPDDARGFAAHLPAAQPLRVVPGANHFTLVSRHAAELLAQLR